MNGKLWSCIRLSLAGASLAWCWCLSPALAETDADIAKCLATGRIVESDEVLVGLTKPLKVRIECEGQQQKAVFKYLDVSKQGVYTLANGTREFNFTDRYQYERAAYLLDRELGLDMVPVAVLRRYRGKDGVLVAWVSDAVNGKGMPDTLPGTKKAALERQKSVMRMFDSLIYNIDRRPENYLFKESSGKLYMIDHSQSFRIKPQLQPVFAENRTWMSEDLYTRLQGLEREKLEELTKGLINRGQVKSLLKRRDLILQKIDADRQEYGDEAVFLSPTR